MKYQFAIIALAAATLNLAACSSSKPDLAPGTYKSSSTSTDSNDTTVSKDTTTNVGYDAYGHKRAVTTTKKTVDPKGLMNESTTQTQSVDQQ